MKPGDLSKRQEDGLIRRINTLIGYIDEQPFYRCNDRLNQRAERQLYSIINQIKSMESKND